MKELGIADLVRRAQRGERAAFGVLVERTARVVYAQVVAAVRDRQKAEDLVQETFVKAWKGIGTIEEPEGALAWLLTVARHVTLDAIKGEGRAKRKKDGKALEGIGEEAVDAQAEPPGERAARKEEAGEALRLLAQLPEDYRRVLAMRYLAGADYESIRKSLGMTDGALRGVLARGMALLRERMGEGNKAVRQRGNEG